MSKYEVTFAIEVARETSAFVLSEYGRYFSYKNISTDEKQNPEVAKYWELIRLRQELIGAETVDEVTSIEKVFEDARKHIKEVYPNAL